MTKKIFSAMMAFAMLFATSCQNDVDSFGASADGTSVVTFSVETPELATRAFSDGTTATVFQYAVYDEEGNELPALTKSIENGNAETINISKNVELQLTTGNTYSVIFWAAANGAPYTVDFASKTMTVDYAEAACNDENRDAFYARHTFTVNGKQTETVKLYRPFAQLNIGTNDYDASTSAGYTPVKSSVKVTNVYSTLDLFEGKVSNPVAAYYDYTAIPTTETFPVDGYEYLSMNYLLVASDKELVEVEFGYTETDATAEKTRIVGSVPVQRNYRTNIFGQLLTSDVDINVEIVPAYNQPDELFPDSDKDKLYLAAAVGGEVTLESNVTLTRPLVFRHSAIINLNGWTITGGVDFVKGETTAADITAITVDNGCELTVNGQGAVYGAEYAFNVVSGATLNIKGDVTAQGGTTAVQVRVGTLNIEGGTYSAIDDPRYTINCINEEYWAGNCNMNITGGTFVKFDPANNLAEGNSPVNFCPEGYTTIQDGDNYIVLKGVTVSNVDEFKAVAADENIENMIIIADLDFGTSHVEVRTNKNIIGNGHKFIAGGKTTKNYGLGIYGADVKINDLVMNGGGGIYVSSGANVEVNNVTLKATYSASSRHLFYVNGSTLTVNSGEFEVLRTSSCYFTLDNNARAYVKGGTYADMQNKTFDRVRELSGSKLEISGGKFQVNVSNYKFDPTPWLADGFKAERVGNYMEVSAE